MAEPTIDVLDLLAMHGPAGRGRPGTRCTMTVVRELEEADIIRLTMQKPEEVGGVASLQRVKQVHHQIAKMVAGGVKSNLIAAAVGLGPMRVHQLMQDPLFLELVEYYKTQKDELYVATHEKLASLTQMAAEELSARLEEKPDAFSNGELMRLVETAGDRSVAPPKVTQPTAAASQQVTVVFAGMGKPQQALPQALPEGTPAIPKAIDGTVLLAAPALPEASQASPEAASDVEED